MFFVYVYFFLAVLDDAATSMCAHRCRHVKRNGKQAVWECARFVRRCASACVFFFGSYVRLHAVSPPTVVQLYGAHAELELLGLWVND